MHDFDHLKEFQSVHVHRLHTPEFYACEGSIHSQHQCLLELPLKNVKIQKRNDNFQNEHLFDPLIEDVIFQVINIGEEVF